MENENIENPDSPKGEEAEEIEIPEAVKERLAKIEEDNKKLYARAKKAEGFELVEGKWVKKEKPVEKPEIKTQEETPPSIKDYIAITKAGVPEEDMDEVINYAKFKKISLGEAVKDKTLKLILNERAEERRSAEAANVRPSTRGSSKVAPETIVENAYKGNLPEKDEDIQKLAEAQMALRKAHKR